MIPSAQARAQGAIHVHISKSSFALFELCPLKYRYEKVERRPPDVPDEASPGLLRGMAGHEAIAELLRRGLDPTETESAENVVSSVLDRYAPTSADAETLKEAVIEGALPAFRRGGDFRWIEELLFVERMPNVTMWGKLDVAIAGGEVAPLEIIDWTFGQSRLTVDAGLASSLGTSIYRMIAGHHDQVLRPIAITQIQLLPRLRQHTTLPSEDEVREEWESIRSATEAIRGTIAADDFPARPGPHCAYCCFRVSCPAVMAGSDEVPL